ncbi:MAG: hypothetical protein SGI77_04415 [Pirellulaceae bacterium]|nr:hypothetical protein [Pirellulaceae bacterium]
MATKKKPTHEIRFGAIRGTLWSNASSSGEEWPCVTLSRRYKNDQDQWQESNSYTESQLLDLLKTATAALQWMRSTAASQPVESMVKALAETKAIPTSQRVRRAS